MYEFDYMKLMNHILVGMNYPVKEWIHLLTDYRIQHICQFCTKLPYNVDDVGRFRSVLKDYTIATWNRAFQ